MFLCKTVKSIIICFLILLSQSNAQVLKDYGKNLTLIASNTEPSLNELVTIQIEGKVPRDFILDSAFIEILYEKEAMEFVEGAPIWKDLLLKDEIVKKEVVVKFLKSGVHSISIYFCSRKDGKGIKFYVGGAFEEDERVQKMRSAIEYLKYTGGKDAHLMPDTTVPNDIPENNPLLKMDQTDSLRAKEIKRLNDSLLKELRKQLDSLKKGETSKIQNPDFLPTNVSTVTPIGEGKIKVIKNDVSAELGFCQDNNENLKLRATNWIVNPSNLGTISIVGEGFGAIFHSSSVIGTCTISATVEGQQVTWGTVTVIDHIDIKGTFSFKNKQNLSNSNCEGAIVTLIDNGNGNKLSETYVQSNGYYEFLNITKCNLRLSIKTITNWSQVLNNQGKPHEFSYSNKSFPTYTDDNNLFRFDVNFTMSGGPYPRPDLCGAFNILQELKKGYEEAGRFSGSPPQMTNVLFSLSETRTGYDDATITIVIAGVAGIDNQWDESVILHEYGHRVMDQYSDITIPTSTSHDIWTASSPQIAYSEGWATFFSCVALKTSSYFDIDGVYTLFFNAETPSVSPNTNLPPKGDDVEGAVCATFWDIYDSSNDVNSDNNDQLYLGISNIWRILDDYASTTFLEFSTNWYNNNYDNISALAAAHGVSVKVTTGGVLPTNECWSGNVTLTNDLQVPLGRTLTLGENTTITFGPYRIISSGGSIDNKSKIILYAEVKQNGIWKAICGTIQSAIDYAVNGQTIQLLNRTYNQSITINGKSITVNGGGISNTILNGNISIINAGEVHIQNLTQINYHEIVSNYSYPYLENIVNDSEVGIISIYSSPYFYLNNIISEVTEPMEAAVWLRSSDGSIDNSKITGQLAGVDVDYGHILGHYNYFCSNGYDFYARNALVQSYNSTYTKNPPESSNYGMVQLYETKQSCGLQKIKALAEGENQLGGSYSDNFLITEEKYLNLFNKISNERKQKGSFDITKYIVEFNILISEYKKQLNKFSEQEFIKSLYSISNCFTFTVTDCGCNNQIRLFFEDCRNTIPQQTVIFNY